MMNHLDHEVLVLHYYGDLQQEQVEECREHLAACEDCTQEYLDICMVLDAVPQESAFEEPDWEAFMAHNRWRRKGAKPAGMVRMVRIAAVFVMALGGVLALTWWQMNSPQAGAENTVNYAPPGEAAPPPAPAPEDPLMTYLSASNELLLDVLDSPIGCDLEGKDIEDQKNFGSILAHERQQALASADIVPARYGELLNDMDGVLQVLDTMDSCAKPEDLVILQQHIQEKDLLMRVHLTLNELQPAPAETAEDADKGVAGAAVEPVNQPENTGEAGNGNQ